MKRQRHGFPKASLNVHARHARIAPPRDVITVWGEGYDEHLLTMALSPGNLCLDLGYVLTQLYGIWGPVRHPRVHWEIQGLEGCMFCKLSLGDYRAVQIAKDGPDESECKGWDQMCTCVEEGRRGTTHGPGATHGPGGCCIGTIHGPVGRAAGMAGIIVCVR